MDNSVRVYRFERLADLHGKRGNGLRGQLPALLVVQKDCPKQDPDVMTSHDVLRARSLVIDELHSARAGGPALQIGLLNMMDGGPIPFFPLINFSWTHYKADPDDY